MIECRIERHLGAACRTPSNFFFVFTVKDSLGLAVFIPLLIIILGDGTVVPAPRVPAITTLVELKVPPWRPRPSLIEEDW